MRGSEAAAARVGCLASDPGVRAARAELLLGKGDTVAAFRICADAMRRDSLCTECMDVYLACLVELGKRNQLFQLGHRCFFTPQCWAVYMSGMHLCFGGQNAPVQLFSSLRPNWARSHDTINPVHNPELDRVHNWHRPVLRWQPMHSLSPV